MRKPSASSLFVFDQISCSLSVCLHYARGSKRSGRTGARGGTWREGGESDVEINKPGRRRRRRVQCSLEVTRKLFLLFADVLLLELVSEGGGVNV